MHRFCSCHLHCILEEWLHNLVSTCICECVQDMLEFVNLPFKKSVVCKHNDLFCPHQVWPPQPGVLNPASQSPALFLDKCCFQAGEVHLKYKQQQQTGVLLINLSIVSSPTTEAFYVCTVCTFNNSTPCFQFVRALLYMQKKEKDRLGYIRISESAQIYIFVEIKGCGFCQVAEW